MTAKTYLVTGARSIGGALIDAILAKSPDATVIVGVRNVHDDAAKRLAGKQNVHVVYIDASKSDTAFAAAKSVEQLGITTIDVIFANAGVAGEQGKTSEAPAERFRATFETNVIGPLSLFQAFKPFLERSHDNPRFAVVSSIAGSLAAQAEFPFSLSAYSVSKAAVNMLMLNIARDEKWLNAIILHPGTVYTPGATEVFGGEESIQEFNEKGLVLTARESATRMVEYVERADKAKTSGHFWDVQGNQEAAW